ncbi:MAG: hypothetical protein KGH63_02605, partial [Candidatus Micrarchaeota archaeon]|nr:hypothetical protein [Candidatus Micrarchaeota archaeon]
MATGKRAKRHPSARARSPRSMRPNARRRARFQARLAQPARPRARASPSHSKSRLGAKKPAHLARTVATALARPTQAPAALHQIGNPLAVHAPAGFLSFAQARRIVILQKQQHLLWSWAIALSILLVFIISVQELAPTFGLAAPLTERTVSFLEMADLLAMLVIGLELYGQYQRTRNAMLFLRRNWIPILALLPLGLMLRALSAVQSLSALRGLQLAGKLDELSVALPSLSLPGVEGAVSLPRMLSGIGLQAHRLVTGLGGVSDFLEMAAEFLGSLL